MNEIVLQVQKEDISALAQQLFAVRQQVKIYTFTGTLGAGKTTLISALLRQWGITQVVTSPTFTYVNVYETPQGELLYHFDLYRISSLDSFVEAGFDEFLYLQKSWAFIEWPDVIKPLLIKQVCNVTMDYIDETTREVRYEIIP